MSSSVDGDPDALPEPPADIDSRKLPLVQRVTGTRYVRIHHATDGAVWFGRNAATRQFRPPTNRFDASDRRYGILYAAATRDGSFAEAIGRKPGAFRSNDELAVTTLALTRDLRLVDLHGGAAVGALGATGVVGVGPQSLARRWAKALHAHPEAPDGIESSMPK